MEISIKTSKKLPGVIMKRTIFTEKERIIIFSLRKTAEIFVL